MERKNHATLQEKLIYENFDFQKLNNSKMCCAINFFVGLCLLIGSLTLINMTRETCGCRYASYWDPRYVGHYELQNYMAVFRTLPFFKEACAFTCNLPKWVF